MNKWTNKTASANYIFWLFNFFIKCAGHGINEMKSWLLWKNFFSFFEVVLTFLIISWINQENIKMISISTAVLIAQVQCEIHVYNTIVYVDCCRKSLTGHFLQLKYCMQIKFLDPWPNYLSRKSLLLFKKINFLKIFWFFF